MFKPGEKIVCVDTSGDGIAGMVLRVGQVYTVKKMCTSDRFVYLIEEPETGFVVTRFKKHALDYSAITREVIGR